MPVTLSSCQHRDAVSMSSVESKAQVSSPCADLTLACCRCLKDADDDVVEDDGKNDDDDDCKFLYLSRK